MSFKALALAVAAATALAAGAAAPALAHHSFAMFANDKTMVVKGTVKEFEWTNPHAWVELMVRDAGGKESDWSIEGASPNSLARFGWSRGSLKAGDHVQATIHPLKDGHPGGSLVRIEVNGQVVGAPKPT